MSTSIAKLENMSTSKLKKNNLNMSRSGLLDVNPSNQFAVHEAFRDCARNHYRTSYSDMIHGRETYVKSDYPSGYGGHIPNIRFDVLFRNTAFDRKQALTRQDPSRDAHPSFKDQLAGIPTYCNKPQGSTKTPSYKVVTHDGTTQPRPPWGVVRPVRELPNHRSVPATLARARSLPSITKKSTERSAPQSVGKFVSSQAFGTSLAQDPMCGKSMSELQDPTYDESTDWPEGDTCQDEDADPLAQTITQANQEATKQKMVSEQELLMKEMMDESGYVTPASRFGGA
jgi:hypothetical protein